MVLTYSRYMANAALVMLLLITSCNRSTIVATSTPVSFSPLFTYSTIDGAVWQIDATGNREPLINADGIHRRDLQWSEDRKWLSYVSEQFSQPQQIRAQYLHVIDRQTRSAKIVLGPASNINSIDWIEPNQIEAIIFDLSVDPQTPPDEIPYQRVEVNVDTEKLVSLELNRKRQPPSQTEIAQARFEPVKSPDARLAISNEIEGDRMIFYLTDASGKQIARIYDQPADFPSGLRLWSPDSRWLIYQILNDNPHQGELYLYDVSNRIARQMTHFSGGTPPSYINNIKWAPNSKWFMFATDANSIANQLCFAKIDLVTAKCFDVQWKSNPINFVLSRDSRMIAFLARMGNQPHDLYALDVDTEKVIQLTNNGDSEIEDWFTAY